MLQLSQNKPLAGVLYGITHDIDGAVILREPKILKVGIGLPRGRALNVWIHNDRKWNFRMGKKGGDGKLEFRTVAALNTRQEAEQFYRDNYAKADPCGYPRKLGFFTFTRPVVADDGTEVFEPDWEAIEAHGPNPTEIDIVFLDDNPFSGGYQMWSTSELRCKGDGINALRVLSMAATDGEKALAADAKANGDKYFPIVNGCWTQGCPYSKETEGPGNKTIPAPCHPGADLKFQLVGNIRVGGTAYFHTGGIRSVAQIFSSLERIKSLTGNRLAGIPLKMVLRPYKTRHNGQAATQYGVSLEFRAQDIPSLRANLMEQAFKFRDLVGTVREPVPARHLLESSPAPVIEEDDDETPISAQAMTDEFYPGDAGEEEPEPTPVVNTAAAATENKTEALAEKLKARSTRAAKPPVSDAGDFAAAPKPTPPVASDSTSKIGDLF